MFIYKRQIIGRKIEKEVSTCTTIKIKFLTDFIRIEFL